MGRHIRMHRAPWLSGDAWAGERRASVRAWSPLPGVLYLNDSCLGGVAR